MIVTKSEPFSDSELELIKEKFSDYVKTVIDIRTRVCSAGMDRHFEGEEILLAQGSKQSDIWGGGVDLATKVVDYNSFINIRPMDNNTSNEIQDSQIRLIYDQLSKFFFQRIYD